MSTKSAAELHKDVPPDWYESSVKKNLGQAFWHWRRFKNVDQFSQKVSGKILDVGSADGFFTREILRVTGVSQIYGVDVLVGSVRYAANRYKHNPQMHFSLGDGHKLKFTNDQFAAVYCLEAMEHVYSPTEVLSEIKRVLKPGGYTIILVPAENWLFSKIIWPLWIKWRGKIWKDTHLHQFSGHKLKSLMSRIGFKNIQEHRFLLGMLLLVKAVK
ncbi:MAG: Methyltransferase type 11 [Candidatus Woesebacteria bacterium GW2011_GWA1_43_12]|uniref:Methyltransferase type 11 n=1 Tax=Candidatus Woesebacteria bacterium GW2011_GWA1_43_12 TaxID=1618557 RepID=A0A0G1CWH3_9BACT|nr:MAG: Methyltransferase type 11 [Candidatus Woesebacteria bacterium GW2011_GWA1_43_12]